MKKQSVAEKLRHVRRARRRALNRKSRGLNRIQRRLATESSIAARKRFAEQQGILFVRDIAREQIILPKILSLTDAHEETAKAVDALRNAILVTNHPVILHFEKLERIDPSAALLLVSEIYRCRQLRRTSTGHSVDGTYPANVEVERQLEEMGFFKLLNVLPRPKENAASKAPRTRPLFLPFLTGTKVQAKIIHQFVEIIEQSGILALNGPARSKLIGALVEAMSNAEEHAYKLPTQIQSMPRRWWMSASVDVALHEVTVILSDQGVGIPGTLDVGLFEGLQVQLGKLEWLHVLRVKRSDGVLIKAATELFRTGTLQPGRGKGFRDMKAFVDKCSDGELRVLSNRGRYHYVGGTDYPGGSTESYSDEAHSIGGTIIEWRIRNAGTVVMDDD